MPADPQADVVPDGQDPSQGDDDPVLPANTPESQRKAFERIKEQRKTAQAKADELKTALEEAKTQAASRPSDDDLKKQQLRSLGFSDNDVELLEKNGFPHYFQALRERERQNLEQQQKPPKEPQEPVDPDDPMAQMKAIQKNLEAKIESQNQNLTEVLKKVLKNQDDSSLNNADYRVDQEIRQKMSGFQDVFQDESGNTDEEYVKDFKNFLYMQPDGMSNVGKHMNTFADRERKRAQRLEEKRGKRQQEARDRKTGTGQGTTVPAGSGFKKGMSQKERREGMLAAMETQSGVE